MFTNDIQTFMPALKLAGVYPKATWFTSISCMYPFFSYNMCQPAHVQHAYSKHTNIRSNGANVAKPQRYEYCHTHTHTHTCAHTRTNTFQIHTYIHTHSLARKHRRWACELILYQFLVPLLALPALAEKGLAWTISDYISQGWWYVCRNTCACRWRMRDFWFRVN